MLLEEPGVDAARHLNPSGAKLGRSDSGPLEDPTGHAWTRITSTRAGRRMDYATSDPPLSPPPSPPRSAARSTIGWWRPMVPPGPPASSPNSCEERTSELGAHLILVERFCVHARM